MVLWETQCGAESACLLTDTSQEFDDGTGGFHRRLLLHPMTGYIDQALAPEVGEIGVLRIVSARASAVVPGRGYCSRAKARLPLATGLSHASQGLMATLTASPSKNLASAVGASSMA